MLILDQALLSQTSRSSYQQALRDGYQRLRFEPELESEFRQYHTHIHLRRQRLAGVLAIVLYALFVLIDFTVLPSYVAAWTMSIRLGLIIPCFLITIWATYVERWRGQIQRLITAAALITGLGTDAIIGIALSLHHNLPYEGILLVALFIYFIAGLLWWRSLVVNAIIFAGLVYVDWRLQPVADLRVYHAAFMFAANFIGAVGSYFLEYSTRTTFLVNLLLRELAERDGLTGLYNRRTLNGQLERTWRQAQRDQVALAMAMIDVDSFKAYNDHYGHTEGDKALQLVASIIAEQAQRPLDLAARYGGEEFVLLWYQPNLAELEKLGERMRQALEERHVPHAASAKGYLTVSLGIAYAEPAKGGELVRLLRQSDAALYQAKQQGRNRTVIFPE